MIKILIETGSLGVDCAEVGLIAGCFGPRTSTKYGALVQVGTFEEAREVFKKWSDWVTCNYSNKSVAISYMVNSNTFELNLI